MAAPVSIPIVVAARMNSRRLPGKVLREIAGRPLLQYVVDNLADVEARGPVIVATSTAPGDDPIAAWCAHRGVACHRGPLDDVAARLIGAARAAGSDAFVRISGDSPLIDPALVEQALALFAVTNADLVTNVQVRTFPKGCSVEVIRAGTLAAHLDRFARSDDREHVTAVFYRHPEGARIVNFTSGVAAGDVQLAVDTIEDLHNFERVLSQIDGDARRAGWRRLAELAASTAAFGGPGRA